MMCYRDMTFCPVEYASGCTKGNSCDRAWNGDKQQLAEAWRPDPPVMFYAEIPSCYVRGVKLEEKYHTILGKVHKCLKRHKFVGPMPDYVRVKHYVKGYGFSVYEITMDWMEKNRASGCTKEEA